MRLLIADDNHDSADSLAMLMRSEGYEVQVAYDGRQTIEAASAFEPDVFILDLTMPALDGFETARRLRAMPAYAEKLFVALTAHAEQTHLDEASRASFDEYLIKPCKLDVLRQILSEAAARFEE